MKIPKKIQIAGREIEIKFDNKKCDDKEIFGESRYRENLIIMQDKTDGITRPKSSIDITLIHEILHWIYIILNYEDLKDDEKMITQVSELLYQVIEQLI